MLVRCLYRHAPTRYFQPKRHSTTFASYFFRNSQWSSPVTIRKEDAPKPPELAAFKPPPALTVQTLASHYAQLSKARLSFLVMLTAMGGVALSPLPTTVPVLLATAAGTMLCSASANTFNQLQEVPFDAQMARTRSRPIVRRAVTPFHAAVFGAATGIAGPALLWTMVNPTTALLGAGNIVLYAGVYTWMKRRTYWNTWVGSIVGAIPPLMGWTACGGHLMNPPQLFLPFSDSILDMATIDNSLAAFALFMLHFSWQFPHFNSLAHFVRHSYAQAGYQMLCVLDAKKNALVSLRHSVAFIPICSILFPLSGLTTWAFALTSLPLNGAMVHYANKFYKSGTEKDARVLFRLCLIYLPLILGLMMVHKQGVDWFSRWRSEEREEKEEPKRIIA